MYAWLWRHLPGGLAGRLAGSLALLLGVLALLFYVAFPWVESKLPYNNVKVDAPPAASTPTPGPSGTASPGP